MSTKIEWCQNPDGTPGVTWNPVTGCSKISEGCQNCYAEKMAKRLQAMGVKKYAHGFDVVCHENVFLPKFKKPKTIFVCSMSDLFHKDVPFEFLRRVFNDIRAELLPPSGYGYTGSNHTFILLTKRPGRMLEFWNWHKEIYSIYPNDHFVDEHNTVPDRRIWIGVTVEDQEHTPRIKNLLQVSAAVHFVSYEPALGPLDLTKVKWAKIPVDPENYKRLGVPAPSEMWSLNDVLISRPADQYNKAKIGLDWIICGGETGPHARPAHPGWVRSLRDQCQEAKVPFFFKAWGEYGTRAFLSTTGEQVFKMFPNKQKWIQKGNTWAYDSTCVDMAGKIIRIGADFDVAQYPVAIMHKVGKKNAERILDGRTWDQMPKIT